MKKIKEFIANLKKINLTTPLVGVIIGLVLVIGYLLNYYGIINVAGLKQQNKQETKSEEPATTESEQPKEEPKVETPAPTPTPAPVASISLAGSAYATGVKLSWSTANVDTSKGFKVVKSTSMNPVYPGSSAVYVNGSTKSYAWQIKDGKTYYFRVCQYTGGACGVYSNNAKVTAPYVATETPKESNSQAKVYWNVDEANKKIYMGTEYTLAMMMQETIAWPSNGFKLVWSKSTSPTYPTRGTDRYNYYSSPSQRYGLINAFDGAGTYYVRVCEYLGGACGVYSNQITVTLP